MLMTHLYYGDPTVKFSDILAETLLGSGADILEVGIPYTDPVCDGEIFQRGCKRAISGGVTPLMVLEGIRRLREKDYEQKIYLTSYYGPIYKMGIVKFVQKAKDVGATGLIVADLLLEEQKELREACDKNGLSLIQFATVYSDIARLKQICRASTDFIYCISLPGVTGDTTPSRSPSEHLEGSRMDSFQVNLDGLVRRLKSITDKKILVGFGIRSAHDVQEMVRMGADGVIVGSAIAGIYEKNISSPENSLPKISSFIKRLKEGTIKEII